MICVQNAHSMRHKGLSQNTLHNRAGGVADLFHTRNFLRFKKSPPINDEIQILFERNTKTLEVIRSDPIQSVNFDFDGICKVSMFSLIVGSMNINLKRKQKN